MDAKVVVVEFLRVWFLAADYLSEILELPRISVAHLAEDEVVPPAHVRRLRLFEKEIHRDLLVHFFDLHASFFASSVPYATEVLDGLEFHYAVRPVDAQMPAALRPFRADGHREGGTRPARDGERMARRSLGIARSRHHD